MNEILLLGAVVVLCSILVQKISSRMKVPMLLGFVLLGMLFGSDGLLSIPFDNYEMTESVSTVCLILIMFYGGFGTSWKEGKTAALPAGVLASAGTVMTALLTAVFCHFAFHFAWLESLLCGSLLASTDAASVFSILRSSSLGLKLNTGSLLEIESGSNDPFAYMMTIVCITLIKSSITVEGIVMLLIEQIGFGILIGFGVFFLVRLVLKHYSFEIDGFYSAFILASALLSYAAASMLGGNGFLAVYLTGILCGNSRMAAKKELVHFFDGLTTLMQIGLFFILGLVSFPVQIVQTLPSSWMLFLFITLIARPLCVFALLAFFRFPVRQMLLVSFAGLRGAASIAFAVTAVVQVPEYGRALLPMVFGVVLFSILIQGGLLPFAARKLDMIDPQFNILKTFSDYQENTDLRFMTTHLSARSRWIGKTIAELDFPDDILIAFIERNHVFLVPSGQTELMADDNLILAGSTFHKNENQFLREEVIEKNDPRIGQPLSQLPAGHVPLILCIKRGGTFLIPSGTTRLQEGDIFVFRK